MEQLQRYKGHILLALTLTILFGGYVLYDRRPQPAPIEIIEPTATPALTAALIRVHVVGAVQTPGVYSLSPESRWIEAIAAAGGMTGEADSEKVNLAQHLQDGQQVRIPRQGETLVPEKPPLSAPLLSVPSNLHPSGGRVNINTATAAQLETLPGIGPAYASRIIAYRQAHQGFTEPAEVMQVSGIGPARYDDIKDLITTE